jgi:hypothetical protein
MSSHPSSSVLAVTNGDEQPFSAGVWAFATLYGQENCIFKELLYVMAKGQKECLETAAAAKKSIPYCTIGYVGKAAHTDSKDSEAWRPC